MHYIKGRGMLSTKIKIEKFTPQNSAKDITISVTLMTRQVFRSKTRWLKNISHRKNQKCNEKIRYSFTLPF